MKKVLFDEIKKSLKNPTPLNQMDGIIHVKKIDQKTQNGFQSVKKSHEWGKELVEYYKLNQNEIGDITITLKSYNTPSKHEKSEDFSSKAKTPVSLPAYVDSFLMTQTQQAGVVQKQPYYQEQLNQNYVVPPQNQQQIWTEEGLDRRLYQKRDNPSNERRQVIIKRRNQIGNTNQILTALAQNRLESLKPRIRAESVKMVNGNVVNISNSRQHKIRCYTQSQENEEDNENHFLPNFENSILAHNFNNISMEQKYSKAKKYVRSTENSPQKKPYIQFMKTYQKKNYMVFSKSPSFDLQSIQCLSQEFIHKNENQNNKTQQQPVDEKQQYKLLYERQFRLSQPDMSRQKETEFPVKEYLQSIKLQSKVSKPNISQLSDYPTQESIHSRPHSRIHTSHSPEKSKNESPLKKRIACIQRNSKIQHNTVLSQKNSIVQEDLSQALFNISQEVQMNELADNSHIQHQNNNKHRNSLSHSVYTFDEQNQPQIMQGYKSTSKNKNNYKRFETQALPTEQTDNQIFKNRNFKNNNFVKSLQNSSNKNQYMQTFSNFNNNPLYQLSAMTPSFIQL